MPESTGQHATTTVAYSEYNCSTTTQQTLPKTTRTLVSDVQIMKRTSVDATKGHLRWNTKCIRGSKENGEEEGKDLRLHVVALPRADVYFVRLQSVQC